MVSEGRYYNKPDPPQLVLRHQLAQAKILAYLGRPSTVARRYGAEGFGPSIYLEDPEGNVVELKGPPEDEG